MPDTRFASKELARQWVWTQLTELQLARFPFPPNGRIPNFANAKLAAQKLFEIPEVAKARMIKINPDSAQRLVRQFALERSMTVLVPSPRLKAGFLKLDPSKIPQESFASAVSLNNIKRWATPIALKELPQIDVVVTGAVAVTQSGKRCGKGHGFADLEYAILCELGMDPPPIATTVHPIQILDDFPIQSHDLKLNWIATDETIYSVSNNQPSQIRLDWNKLSEQQLVEMPILGEIKQWKNKSRKF